MANATELFHDVSILDAAAHVNESPELWQEGVPRGEVRRMLRDDCVKLYGLTEVPTSLR